MQSNGNPVIAVQWHCSCHPATNYHSTDSNHLQAAYNANTVMQDNGNNIVVQWWLLAPALVRQ